jgi:sensor histidine kinase YesM
LNSKPLWTFFRTLVIFTLITGGIASIGMLVEPDHAEHKMLGGAFVISGIFSFSVLGISLPAWMFMLRRSVPDTPKAIIFHASVVIAVMLVGFALGNVLVSLYMAEVVGYEWGPQDVAMSFLITVIGTLGANFAYYGNYFYRRSVDAQKEAVAAQMQMLRAQLQPHFLFNSLNTIASLARTAPEKAEAVTEDLAEVFRYSLQTGAIDTVPLHEELKTTRLYLNIETARFGDRLIVDEQVDEAAMLRPVPALLLQPLVENAVKHGLGRTEAPCRIVISAVAMNRGLKLSVTDDGPGFESTDPAVVLPRGIGLQNVAKRLDAMYGRRAEFTILKHGIEILIPIA